MAALVLVALAFLAFHLLPAAWAPAPTTWALASAAAWAAHLLLRPRPHQPLSGGEQMLVVWGFGSCLALLSFLKSDPTFQGWGDVYFFCGRDMRHCACDFRWTASGWRKAAVLWNFALASALGAQRLLVQIGLDGFLPGEEGVTFESFVSVCWRLVPYYLNAWESKWGAECSSMMFELPHFATELLVVLPCAQILAGRLKILAAPHVTPQLPPGPLGLRLSRALFAPNVLRARWEQAPDQRRLLPRVRANRRVLAAVAFVAAIAAGNSLLAPLRLEDAALAHPLRQAVAAAAALPAGWPAASGGESGGSGAAAAAAAAQLRAAAAEWEARKQPGPAATAGETLIEKGQPAAAGFGDDGISGGRGEASLSPYPAAAAPPPGLQPTMAAAAAAAAAGQVPWAAAGPLGALLRAGALLRRGSLFFARAFPRGRDRADAGPFSSSSSSSATTSGAFGSRRRGGGSGAGDLAAAVASAGLPPSVWEALAQRFEAHEAAAGGGKRCPDAAARMRRNLERHSKELGRMEEPQHRALVVVVEVALALMRLGCERFFLLASLHAAYVIFHEPPAAARAAVAVNGAVSAAFQWAILYSFPAVCWHFGAGVAFSAFVTFIFWGSAAARVYAWACKHLVSVSVSARALRPAGPGEIERMGGGCAICWGRMTAAAVGGSGGGGGGAAAGSGGGAGSRGASGGGAGGAGLPVPEAAAVAAAAAEGEQQQQQQQQQQQRHEEVGGQQQQQTGEQQQHDADTDTEADEGGEGVSLPCGHAYHSPCLHTWLEQCRSQGTVARCPMCQATIALDVKWRLHLPPRPAAAAPADDGGGGGADRRARRAARAAAVAAFWGPTTNYIVGPDLALRSLLLRLLHAPVAQAVAAGGAVAPAAGAAGANGGAAALPPPADAREAEAELVRMLWGAEEAAALRAGGLAAAAAGGQQHLGGAPAAAQWRPPQAPRQPQEAAERALRAARANVQDAPRGDHQQQQQPQVQH